MPGRGRLCLHSHNFLHPLPRGLFPSCPLSPSTSLVFPRPGWEEAPPLGDAVKRGRGENAGAPLAPGRRWLAVGGLVGGVCVRGEGGGARSSFFWLQHAQRTGTLAEAGSGRGAWWEGSGALVAKRQKDKLRERSGAGSCCCLPWWRCHGEPCPWSPSVPRKQEAPWQMLLGMTGFVCLF